MNRRAARAVGRLRAGGRRMTVQRRAVLQAMAVLGCARRPEEIHRKARRIYPALGLVTVYRALDALRRDGLADAVAFADGRARFELTDEGRHHHHLVCVSCGTVTRLEDCAVPAMGPAARRQGFSVTSHRLELFGYCRDCRRRPARPPGARRASR